MARMGFYDEFRYTLRYQMPKLIALLTAGVLLALGVFALAYWMAARDVKPNALPDGQPIPSTVYGYGAVQVYDCVRQGPECSSFEDSKAYLRSVSAATAIFYTPLSSTGEIGQEKVASFTPNSTDEEFRAFGREVTGDGLITPGTAYEENFIPTADPNVIAFTATPESLGERVDGTMTLTTRNGESVVQKITYTKGQ